MHLLLLPLTIGIFKSFLHHNFGRVFGRPFECDIFRIHQGGELGFISGEIQYLWFVPCC